jgi:hypothetical protein
MEADWEFEVGGGAPVIEARWAGFVDLRRQPERIKEIHEAAALPPLAALRQALNGTHSPLWTAKCDLWETEAKELAGTEAGMHSALACYVDLLPLAGEVFAQAEQAEDFCREWVARLAPVPLPDCRVDLVIRQALAGKAEGLGVTAYLSAMGSDHAAAREALAATLAAFADTIPDLGAPETPTSKLQ